MSFQMTGLLLVALIADHDAVHVMNHAGLDGTINETETFLKDWSCNVDVIIEATELTDQPQGQKVSVRVLKETIARGMPVATKVAVRSGGKTCETTYILLCITSADPAEAKKNPDGLLTLRKQSEGLCSWGS